MLIINDEKFIQRAEIIREKGTNRSLFFRGMVDKYSWVDLGSSYLPCELQAAYLWGQLENADVINENRLRSWNRYYQGLSELSQSKVIDLPTIPDNCTHNAHMFYIKVSNMEERTKLIEHLKQHQISTAFHYVPLHSSVAGEKFGKFSGLDNYTTKGSECLLRLPMFYGLMGQQIDYVISSIKGFYGKG